MSCLHQLLLPPSQQTQPCGSQASLCGLTLSCGPCQEGLTAFCLQLGQTPKGPGPPLAAMERWSWHECNILHFQTWTVVKGGPGEAAAHVRKITHSFIHFFNRCLLRPCSVPGSGLGSLCAETRDSCPFREKDCKETPCLRVTWGPPFPGFLIQQVLVRV